jgi:hypothetical protein
VLAQLAGNGPEIDGIQCRLCDRRRQTQLCGERNACDLSASRRIPPSALHSDFRNLLPHRVLLGLPPNQVIGDGHQPCNAFAPCCPPVKCGA